MEKKYSISVCIVLMAIVSIFSQVANGQNKINWKEIPNLAQKVKDVVPEGKALLVFESKEDFRFDSDNENIIQPQKEGLLYKLLIDIEPSSGAIYIQHKGADREPINYGKTTYAGSLPALKSKDIKYFRLSLIKPLIHYDITRTKKKEGATDFQGLYEKEALIILYVAPQNLDLQIEGSEITKTIHEEELYKIYTKPEAQKIILKSKNFDDTPIDFEDLVSKDVRYYHIEIPQSNIDAESFDPNTKVGNYLIESTPAGALIQMVGNPAFNKLNCKTPFTIEGYKSGTEIITLNLNRYETITDTILISSSKGKKSKNNLIPKFAFINCNIEPAIPVSKILMDGKELSSIVNGQNYECLKGTHNVEINAPHFYSETRQISLAAGATNEVNIKLKPKMGMLSILSGNNADGAEVTINGRKVGKIPVGKLSLQEGTYTINFEKSGFMAEMSTYSVDILENKLTDFKGLKMINAKNVAITTSPVRGATVYIDDKVLSEKSNLHVKLGIGKHSIKIEREHYESLVKEFTVDQENDAFNFNLVESAYEVSVSTKPEGSDILVDGVIRGVSPLSLNMPLGSHSLMFKNSGYLTKRKIISVSKPMSLHTKLFPSSYLILGADYGLSQYGLNAGFAVDGILVMAGVHKNLNTNNLSKNNLAMENVTAYDISQDMKEIGRIYSADSVNYPFNFKLGFTVKKPFIFVVTAGCAIIQTDKFQKIYKASHDYIAQNSGTIIHAGDLFSEPYLTKHAYTAITGGLFVPIAQTLYLSVDYYSDSDIGPGLSFGLGFIIH